MTIKNRYYSSSEIDSFTGVKSGRPIAFSGSISFDLYAVYETEVSFEPYIDDVQIVTTTGTSDNAPFGLTELDASNYSTIDEDGRFLFGGDPEDFGVEGEILMDKFSGEGENELFGISSGMGEVDFEAGVVSGIGEIEITGGQGIFKNASGTLTFEETEVLAEDNGTAVVSGTVTVPIASLLGF